MQKVKSKSAKSGTRSWDWLLPVVLIILASGWVYFPSFSFGFTNWDDPTYVKDNPLIRDFSWAGFKKLFTVFLSGNYHPFVLVSYWMEMKWGGGDPGLFHKLNWILHAANSILIYLILSRHFSGKFAALAGALLFAVHPLHVESVAWITERKDVLYGFFLLLSLWVYQFSKPEKWDAFYFTAILLFIASGLSKGQAVILVPALILFDYLQGRDLFSRIYILRIIPFVLLALGIGILAVYAQQNQANVRIQTGYGLMEQVLIGFQGIWFYTSRTLYAYSLSAFYPYPSIAEGIPSDLYIKALGGITVITITILLYFKERKIFIGLALFLITLFPVLQFLPVGNAIMADRYYYIPAFGLCMVLASLIQQFAANWNENRAKGILFIVLLFIIFQTWSARQRMAVWKDSFTLWQNVIDNYPEAAIAWNSLANAWYEQNEYVKAAGYFEEAIKLDTSDPKSFNNLGNCYNNTGRPELAIEQFNRALVIRPNDPMVYTNLGVAYDKMGQSEKAIEANRQSVTIAPSPLGYANLANVLEKAGRLEESAEACRKAIALDPNYGLAHNNLGVALYKMGKIEEAIESLKKAAQNNYRPAQDFLAQNGITW